MSNTSHKLRLSVAGLLASSAVLLLSVPALAAGPAPDALSAPASSVYNQAEPTPVPEAPDEDRRIIRGDEVVTGDNFTLRSNETLRGNLSVFGGNAVLEEGSRVEGSVTAFGGNTDVAGAVTGDLSVIGGSTRLRASARIEGDLSRLGGSLTQDPGAVVEGQSNRFTGPRIVPPTPPRPFDVGGRFRWIWDGVGNFFGTVASILVITLLSIAAIALFPANARRAERTIRSQWLASGAIGVLTYVAVPIVIVIMSITICLIPAAILLALALAVLVVCGWAVVARMVGEWLMVGFKQTNWTPVGQTAAGAVALAVLGAIPVIGWLVGFVASSIGMGALILTVAGTKDYPRPPLAPVAPVGPVAPVAPVVPAGPVTPVTLPQAPATVVTTHDVPPAPPASPEPPPPPADEPKA